MRGGDELRAFLAWIMGWSDTHAVELALSSVTLAAAGCTTLVLCGEGDMVPIAWGLHRRVREPARPFIVADPRRGEQLASVRSPTSQGNAVEALDNARRGTCCMRLRRAPADLAEGVPLLRTADDVMFVVCDGARFASDALLIRPAPVVVPSLASRAQELDRIIAEYPATRSPSWPRRAEASPRPITRGCASSPRLRSRTLKWPRCGWWALHTSRNLSHAAARVGMAAVSLSRWLGRRELPR